MILMEQIKYSKQLLYPLFFQVARAEPESEEEAWAVKVNCVGGTMTITVTTKEPFYGVVHGRNRSEPGCSVQGNGGLKTRLKVDLSVPEGTPGNCGVRYNPVRVMMKTSSILMMLFQNTEEKTIGVGVRAHNQIELLDDRLYQIRCGKAGFNNSRDSISFPQLKITDDYGVKKSAVIEGSQYTLDLEVLNHDPAYGTLIKSCVAFDNFENSLQLVDDRGCRTTKLLSEFTYDDEAGKASATLYSMFRMTNSNRTYFQCDVKICRGSCPKPTCNLDQELIGNRLDQSELNSVDPFSRPQLEDTITTSTSVFVAEPGSAAALGAGACLAGDLNPTWLTYLCIAFGVLFGIMLLINIFLCSAMTCSCTRTEVIEKEPSVYDDDIYDTKTYSDPGSEEYTSQFGAVASEADTYRSDSRHPPAKYLQ